MRFDIDWDGLSDGLALHQLDPSKAGSGAGGGGPENPRQADGELDAIIAAASLLAGKDEGREPDPQGWLAQVLGGSAGDFDNSTSPMRGLARGVAADNPSTTQDVITRVSALSDAELTNLQRRLFQAGFYSSDVYGNAAVIQWGVIDDHTLKALRAAFEKAATNRVEDFDAFLANERARFLRTGRTVDGTDLGAAAAGLQGGGSVVDVTLEDPDAIKITAERTAIELLGRKPTEEELAKITASIHDQQRKNARARAAAQQDETAQALGALDTQGTEALLTGESVATRNYNPANSTLTKLTGEQYEVARTIIQVGQEMGLSEEYIIGALSAGIVESGLRNVNYGDRDSLGVFQQREQGYGDASRRLDVRTAATMYFQEMLRVGARPGETIGQWVARTQRPAKEYEGRYDERIHDAARIYELLVGGQQSGIMGASVDLLSGPPANPRQADGPTVRPVRVTNPAQADLAARQGRLTSRAGTDLTHAGPIPRSDAEPANPFWLDEFASVGADSMADPIFNEMIDVNVEATIAEHLRKSDPLGYSTRQIAARAAEFFSLLRAAGGLV